MTLMWIILAWNLFWLGIAITIEMILAKNLKEKGIEVHFAKRYWRTIVTFICVIITLFSLSILNQVEISNDTSPNYTETY